MTDTLSPTSAEDVLAAVRDALAQESPLEIVGGGTKRGWGRSVKSNRVLDLSRLSGVTLYEPEELVLSAKAGTKLAEIKALLAEHKQMLAFEPPEFAPVYGGPAGRQTLGGIIACNLAGPRRIKAGAARDHFLGFRAVSGRGEPYKAGGRVMKNVTGYDLPKLLCGSFGTLAVMTDITLKVLPAPEKARTVLILGLDDARACEAMAAALNSPHDVSGAAHLPRAVAARSGVNYVHGAGHAVTALRVEGFGPSVEARCQALRALLKRFGPSEELHTMNSGALWREIRDVAPLLPDGPGESAGRDLWRLSVPPAEGAVAVTAMRNRTDTDHYFDWGGGLVWLAVAGTAAAEATSLIRGAVALRGGHATLIRASPATREIVPAFHPVSNAEAAIAERMKDAFDPKSILNPGRMD